MPFHRLIVKKVIVTDKVTHILCSALPMADTHKAGKAEDTERE